MGSAIFGDTRGTHKTVTINDIIKSIMLDRFKNIGRGLASKVADKAVEVNTRAGKKASSEQYIVGLDIGTEFVKVLIGHIKGSNLEIVGVGRAHQELSDMQAGAIADISLSS